MPGPNSADTSRTEGGRGDGEFEAIARLAELLAASGLRPGPGETWIGDDAAVLPVAGPGATVLTTDLVVEGVHGDTSVMSVADMGWRAMVASLSDVAAMGAVPGHAVVSVAGPPETDLEQLYAGIAEAASRFGCPVVGGDLSSAHQLVVSVAMTGDLDRGSEPVLRSGARPGDGIFVTGPLGASAAGLRLLAAGSPVPAGAESLVQAYRRPLPHLAEGVAARTGGASAMIDVSDGLSGDLGHVADASGVGFELWELPVAEGATVEDALYGGEDYQLLVTASDEEALREAFAAAGLASPLVLGTCVEDTGVRRYAGRTLGPGSFQHHFSTSGFRRRRS